MRALRYRRQRLLLAFGALAVAAALATVLFGIYASVEQRIRDEFRAYGANLVAVPLNGGTVPLGLADAAKREGADARPVLVTSAQIDGRAVAVAGVTAGYPYWHVTGSSEIGPGKCLAGESLGLAMGTAVLDCHVSGVVTTGGPEDREIIVDFATAASLAGIHNAASAIEIEAPGERLDAIRAKLAVEFPAADIRTVRAVAGTESNVVVKMRAALALLTLLILAITTLCVTSNFSEMVIDRAKEIGIMKALGGAEQRIAAFFLSESATLAVAATAIGYTVGVFAAAAIGSEIFGGAFHVQLDWRVLAGVGAVMLVVATAATAMATARIWNIQPAVILRGE
ncbi:MAG TPA: ABC transporter permease [Bryobacteraceae bacterium]|nr:ABC transporter permease [Bryobacteraceae bacterium]